MIFQAVLQIYELPLVYAHKHVSENYMALRLKYSVTVMKTDFYRSQHRLTKGRKINLENICCLSNCQVILKHGMHVNESWVFLFRLS